VLATLEGGCSAPIGALAEVAEGDDGDELWIRAVAMSPDGTIAVRMSITGTPEHAADLGARLATDMLAEGAGALTDAPAETVRRL
jgi:hydroxymethylbilane synthase